MHWFTRPHWRGPKRALDAGVQGGVVGRGRRLGGGGGWGGRGGGGSGVRAWARPGWLGAVILGPVTWVEREPSTPMKR